ncbi:hypothetical protein D3C76_1691570 [compost metagenome]
MHRREVLLQMSMDQLGKAVAVRAEKHRIGGLGGELRMREQQAIQARPAYAATQQAVVCFQHLGVLQLPLFVGADQPRCKRP